MSSEQESGIKVVQDRKLGGFTLLELLVVCALMGLLLMSGVPAFRQAVIDDSLRSDSRKLIG
jgi:prepilin-type N-terminal cleavage/methylation domain-containing protein